MKTIRRPQWFHGWTAVDVGFVDQTGILVGWVDYLEATIVVEAESLLTRATTQEIADRIEALEREVFGKERRSGGHPQPYVRVSDVDHRLIADLRTQHGLTFRAIEGKSLESDVNLVNVRISGKQLLVSDRCEHLRRQLRSGKWNNTKKDMAKDTMGGHFDLLAALRYGVRHAETLLRVNPYPPGHRAVAGTASYHRPPEPEVRLGPDTPLTRRLMDANKGWAARLFGAKGK